MPFTLLTQGTVTQPATAVIQTIPLPSGCDYFKLTNLTQMALSGTVCVGGEWAGGGLFADNNGIRWRKAGTHAILIDNFTTSTATNGFTYVTKYPDPEAAVTGTTITNASPAVCSATNTYSEGDTVVIYNAVGMQQISGMYFTISTVTGSAFTLLGLDASGFSASATAFTVRRVASAARVQPQSYYITKISQAASAVVTLSQAHTYVVGQAVELTIPGSCGMVQFNNYYQPQSKPPVITAVGTYTITLNVNSTGYTAFALPASSASPTAQLFPTVASAGQQATYNTISGVQTGYNFLGVPFHSGLFVPYMKIGLSASGTGAAGAANDVLLWQAYKMETGTINSPVPS